MRRTSALYGVYKPGFALVSVQRLQGHTKVLIVLGYAKAGCEIVLVAVTREVI